MIIGIAGGTGSGKTTVVNKIMNNFPKETVTILFQDNYYRDNSHIPLKERQMLNFDHPSAIEFELMIQHIKELRKGQAVNEPQYSFITCTRLNTTQRITPREVIIVEGILILTNPELRDLFDLKIFVYADDDERLIRIIQRDITDRLRSAEETIRRYKKTVKPMHEQFIKPSMSYADLIIPEGGNNVAAIEMLSTLIEKKLGNDYYNK
jgi:uridine kinase